MNYTKEEREFIKQSINPMDFGIIDKSYDHFIKWYHDYNIEEKHRDILVEQLISTATPSVIYPQYIRLEVIEYWKEKFKDYPFVIEYLNNIH